MAWAYATGVTRPKGQKQATSVAGHQKAKNSGPGQPQSMAMRGRAQGDLDQKVEPLVWQGHKGRGATKGARKLGEQRKVTTVGHYCGMDAIYTEPKLYTFKL